jgi:L-gulonate 5-dehydrogenase
MRAAKLTEKQKIALADVPKPEPGAGEVLVQIHAAGICGTDLHIYAGHRPDIQLPRIMGHEFAGVVAALGDRVSGFVEGDHVTVDPVVACGQCYACRRGRRNLCTSIMCLGCQTEGGFQDFLVVKSGDVHKVKPVIPFEHAAMCEPFAIAAQVLERSEVKAGQRVAVFGAGTIGLCILQVFKMVGAEVLITDIVDSRLGKAKELGADAIVNPDREDLAQAVQRFAGEEGVDCVVEAVGNPKLIDAAVGIVTRGGRIVVLPQVVEWLEQGRINPAAMITATYPVERIDEAFAAVTANPQEYLKVMITF